MWRGSAGSRTCSQGDAARSTRTTSAPSRALPGAHASSASRSRVRQSRSSSPLTATARGLDTREEGLLPSGTTGVVVVDLSLSIADEDYHACAARSGASSPRTRASASSSSPTWPTSSCRPGRLRPSCKPMLRLLIPPRLGNAGQSMDTDVPGGDADLDGSRARAWNARARQREGGLDPPRERPGDGARRRPGGRVDGRRAPPELDRAARLRARPFERRARALRRVPRPGRVRRSARPRPRRPRPRRASTTASPSSSCCSARSSSSRSPRSSASAAGSPSPPPRGVAT